MKEQGGTAVLKWRYVLPVVGLLYVSVLALAACDEGAATPWPTPVLPDALPHSMKGYELYSWRTGDAWRFTLITGTNQSKRYDEIVAAENVATGSDWIKVSVEGTANLGTVLERLPAGETVNWHGERWLTGAGEAEVVLPDGALFQEIEARCQELGIQLEVVE